MVKVEWNRYSKSYLTFQFMYMIWHWITRESQIKVIEVYFCTEILRKWGKLRANFAEKNIGMNMSLFLYGNSAEMRETAWGKFCGEKTEAWKWDYFCMEFCGNEGNWGKIMYSNIFIYVSLIGNGTWKNVCQQQSTEFFSPISIQFRTFPYRDAFPSDVMEMYGNIVPILFGYSTEFCRKDFRTVLRNSTEISWPGWSWMTFEGHI